MLLPENFVNRLDAELPNEAAALIQKKYQGQPPVSVRLNLNRTGAINLPLGESEPWAGRGYYLNC